MSDKRTVGGEKSQSGSDGTIGLIEWNLNERLSCCRCVWRRWSGDVIVGQGLRLLENGGEELVVSIRRR